MYSNIMKVYLNFLRILNINIWFSMFLASFLWPTTFLLYFMSAVIGFGASVIWTGQGLYLTLNSDSSTMSRNSGVFWALLQMRYVSSII